MDERKPEQKEVVEGFIRLEEFPVSLEFEEKIRWVMALDEQGEYTSLDDVHFESWMDMERRYAFPTPKELAALPSWKELQQSVKPGTL